MSDRSIHKIEIVSPEHSLEMMQCAFAVSNTPAEMGFNNREATVLLAHALVIQLIATIKKESMDKIISEEGIMPLIKGAIANCKPMMEAIKTGEGE